MWKIRHKYNSRPTIFNFSLTLQGTTNSIVFSFENLRKIGRAVAGSVATDEACSVALLTVTKKNRLTHI